MPNNHYSINTTLPAGRELYRKLANLASAWDDLTRLRGILIQSKVNGASGDAVYADIATMFGYPDAATAAASFAELDSAFAGDAAITQMLNRHL